MTFTYNIRYDQQRISSVDSNLKRPFLHSLYVVFASWSLQRSGLLRLAFRLSPAIFPFNPCLGLVSGGFYRDAIRTSGQGLS
jgi:hypothetical protein